MAAFAMALSRYAFATALATFFLLLAGALVSTTESGLACPDWPLCEGEWIPPMVDGKEYEHTHRLAASFVGVMTFGLCALLFKHRRKDALLKRLGVAACVLVLVQALLGALTVKLKLPAWVSSTHLATAMLFFALTVSLAHLTYQRRPGGEVLPTVPRERVAALALVSVGLLYVQIVAGAVMRHIRGGLACGYELYTCRGELWPTNAHAGQLVHLLHRTLGVVTAVVVVVLGVRLWRAAEKYAPLRRLGALVVLGVVGQVLLGFATVLMSRDMVVMTLHSSLAALLLAALVSVPHYLWPSRATGEADDASTMRAPRPSLEIA